MSFISQVSKFIRQMSCNAPDVEGHISDVIHTSGVDVQTDRRAGPPPAWRLAPLPSVGFIQRTMQLIRDDSSQFVPMAGAVVLSRVKPHIPDHKREMTFICQVSTSKCLTNWGLGFRV